MSALPLSPSPRLRLVSVRSAQEPDKESARPRPRLRLVTEGFESATPPGRTSGARKPQGQPGPSALQAQRRAAREAVRQEGSGRELDALAALAPQHPAVRARLRAQRDSVQPPQVRGQKVSRPVPPRPRLTYPVAVTRRRPDGASAGRRASMLRGAPAVGQVRRERPSGLSLLPVGLRLLLVASAVVLSGVLVAGGLIIGSATSSAPARTATAVVQSGQSLWDVAAGTGASDVNEAMAQIVELNDLSTSTLQAGQTLLVPAS